jgi:protein-S-isoprenylcysteine O-methyltransferase Ste14
MQGCEMSRIFILIYGVLSYFIGVAGLVCIIAALAGFLPYGFLSDGANTGLNPIIWNLGLVSIWGVIHTLTARPSFKAAHAKVMPKATERATYVLLSGLTSIALIGYWATMSGMVWALSSPILVYMLWGLFLFGWAFLLASTFAINHFDLFGLRQVYANFQKQPIAPLRFVERAMYKYIRHPIQTGILLGVWATPTMSMTQIWLSIGFTVYIFVGLWFEERDLIAEHGDIYEAYRKSAGKLLPKFRK